MSVCLLQMYMGGQLVHADYMFNGYGTTKRDFMKQVGNVVLTPGDTCHSIVPMLFVGGEMARQLLRVYFATKIVFSTN